ncbi:hypothetical protein [Hymenobacter arcticus]
MSLQTVPITDQLAWLPQTPATAAPAAPGLPPGYAAYLKLLPPLGIDLSVPIAEYSFAQRTVAELNARAAFWKKYGIVQGQPSANRLETITYREVAAALDLVFDAQFSGADIARAYGGWPPHLGSSPALEAAFVQQLIQALGSATAVYFYGSAEEGNGYRSSDGFPADWLTYGLLADLPEVREESGGLPTYFFAADHSWCFYQGESADLVVGCAAPLAQALLAQAGLEALPLTTF